MKINDTSYRTIWPTADNTAIEIIDQTKLPHLFETVRLESMRSASPKAGLACGGKWILEINRCYRAALGATEKHSAIAPFTI